MPHLVIRDLCLIHLCDRWQFRTRTNERQFVFFFNDTPPPEIYTLSLHDALPILLLAHPPDVEQRVVHTHGQPDQQDRKSTRLNSSHMSISYAVFCLKKKTRRVVVIYLRPA